MNIQVEEINGKLICVKPNHNEPMNMVIIDDFVPMQDRLLCARCFQQNRIVARTVGIEYAKEMINDKLRQQEEIIFKQQAKLKQFQIKMKELKTEILSFIDESARITDQWIQERQKADQNNQLANLIKGLELLSQSRQIQDEENNPMIHINTAYIEKINLLFEKKSMVFQDCYNILKQVSINNSLISLTDEQQMNHDCNVRQQHLKVDTEENKKDLSQTILINRMRQSVTCTAIAFNNNSSIMVAGYQNWIKIWKFDCGQIKEEKWLTKNEYAVKCLVFDQKINWFSAGCFDNTIRCWKEQPNGEWICSQPGQSHTSEVNCLILCDDQLISCSDDESIKVWRIDIKNNQIYYDYTLEEKHQGRVFCISLNQSQTFLASCCLFTKIHLWSKGKQNKWEFQNEIQASNYGVRMCFINDFQIVWQQYGCGISDIFDIQQGQLIQRSDLKLQYSSEFSDKEGCQTIFNKRRQLIVQKHNQYIYLLKQQKNGKLKVVWDPIDCFSLRCFGALTNDGQYLVIFNQEEFRIYQLNYK